MLQLFIIVTHPRCMWCYGSPCSSSYMKERAYFIKHCWSQGMSELPGAVEMLD